MPGQIKTHSFASIICPLYISHEISRFCNRKWLDAQFKNKQRVINYKMKEEDDYIYFAEELHQITPRIIPSSFGNIYSLTAGMPGQPLILVVHGSGPKNSADQYAFLLHQYLVRVSYIEKFYVVAIDCPGYGRSEGSKEAVKTFPLKLFQQILGSLRYKNYFAMLGHSQGGAAIFNAVYEDPTITDFLVMDRPVCGNIQRFRGFSLPTLLIYDIEDDGHPIWQGKLLYKQLKNTQLYTYRNSAHTYWVPDNIWQRMLDFFAKQFKAQRKFQVDIGGERKNKSYSKQRQKPKSKSKSKKISVSMDKVKEIEKREKVEQKLIEIQEIEKSELMSISHKEREEEIEQYFTPVKKIEYKMQRPRQICKEDEQVEIYNPVLPKRQEILIPDQMREQLKEKPVLTKQQLLEQNKCAICYEILYRPMITNCNHLFCNKCLLQSLLVNDKCPLCRAKITKKTENKELHTKLIQQLSQKDLVRRQNDFKRIETMMKSIIYIEIGNNSRQLQTKQSIFTKTKKKYIWQLFVKQPRNFPLEEVCFNINMGDVSSKPVRVRQAPYVFQSRGTFSFACEITIRPKNKEYGDLVSVYRIDIEPGTHSKIIALKKKCYQK